MTAPVTGTMVEGVSDELVVGFLAFILGVIPFAATMLYWNESRSNNTTIHPESQEAVDTARTHLPGDEGVNGANRGGQNAATNTEDDPASQGAEPRRRGNRTDQEITCPICLSDAVFAVETNCGHKFCGHCMITYWNHGNWLGAVRCPSCRQTVNILLSIFSYEERRTDSPEKTTIVNEINRYNRRFSGEPLSWMDYIRDLPTMLRHCFRDFFSVGGLIWMFRLRVCVCFFAAILYFISPFDLVPEAAFGVLGFLDDFFILLLLAIYISLIYRRVIVERAMHTEA